MGPDWWGTRSDWGEQGWTGSERDQTGRNGVGLGGERGRTGREQG